MSDGMPMIATDLDPERTVLGFLLRETQIPEALRTRLDVADFSPQHRLLASAVLAAFENHSTCDLITVGAELTRLGGGITETDRLLGLAEAAPIGGDLAHLYHVMRERNGREPAHTPIGHPQENDGPQFVAASVLWDEADDPIEYDVDGLLVRGSRGWFSSAPRYGKSYLSLHLASRLAAGLPFLDHYTVPEPRNVTVVSEEDGRSQVKRRLKLSVPSEERDLWQDRFMLLIESGLRLDEERWQTWLLNQIREHKTEVLILDVWRWLHSADTNSERELKPILSFLTQLQRKHALTIIILTHDSKPKQGPEGSKEARRITGNWSQWAWAQFGWFLKKRGNVVEVEVEGKDLEAAAFAFRFEGHEGGLRFTWQPPKMTEGEERRKTLAAYLMERPGEWQDLQTLAEACRASVKDSRQRYAGLAD